MKKNFLVIFILCLLLSGCDSQLRAIPINHFGSTDKGNFTFFSTSAFAESGTVFERIELPKCSQIRLEPPKYSVDQRKILIGSIEGMKNPSLRYPIILNENLDQEFACKDLVYLDWVDFYDAESNTILSYFLSEIAVYDMEECEKIDTLINFNEVIRFTGFDWNPNLHLLAYSVMHYQPESQRKEYELHVYNPGINPDRVIAEGLFPAWSKDGTLLAYLQDNALIILDLEWSVVRKVEIDNYRIGLSDALLDWDETSSNLLVSIYNSRDTDGSDFLVYHYSIAEDMFELIMVGANNARWMPSGFCLDDGQ